ncbi:hypothetical protein L798_08763 [Zootermopsis nevadensis]|uniref:Uncharacterized protein n=1 Tax=Zootermopsis nevadensis TaxID=136037 RepID=A0A067RBB2_ZOONE|nr:hypothetical protein L798_08763 [Zootermopsis nevadensis]
MSSFPVMPTGTDDVIMAHSRPTMAIKPVDVQFCLYTYSIFLFSSLSVTHYHFNHKDSTTSQVSTACIDLEPQIHHLKSNVFPLFTQTLILLIAYYTNTYWFTIT